MGNADICRIELDHRQRDERTERRSGQKQRRDVKVEPTHAVGGTGWVMKLKIGVMDQVGGPASIVKGISNIIETMEYVNSVRQKWNCDYDCGQHYNANGFYKNALTHHDIHILPERVWRPGVNARDLARLAAVIEFCARLAANARMRHAPSSP